MDETPTLAVTAEGQYICEPCDETLALAIDFHYDDREHYCHFCG